ncbi:MAG: NAD-dependent epimerase/dehydratase family protein [Myxococcales bacterium]|nr:NAD-dependent epimerase/dehydratase family protein [Myxococcales bacterium]
MTDVDSTTAKTRSLVTGGLGFVGRHLVNALADRGDAVTAVDLRAGESSWRDDVALRQLDLRDPAAVSELVRGHDIVFHNASLVHTKHNRVRDVWDVNLGGTENVLAACREHGVARLVYVSSASVVYEGRDIEGGDESLPYCARSQAPYADSKIAAEKLALAANSPELATVSIRPHVIFGPGDTRLLPAILERARAGKLKYQVGSGEHLSDFTYVDNLVDALLAAGDRLAPGSPVAGQAYFITNGEPMGFFEFVKRVLAQLELPPIRGRVPYALAWSVAALAEAWDTLKGGTLNAEDGMSRFAIRYLCTHHYFDISKAARDLDYAPAVSIEEGIRRTVAAIQAQAS